MVEIRGDYEYDSKTGRITGVVNRFFEFGDTHPNAGQLIMLMCHPTATKEEARKALADNTNMIGQQGKTTPLQRLTVLGAYRVRNSTESVEAAKKYANKNKTPGGIAPNYSSDESWSRAMTEAKINIASVMRRLL